MNKLNIDYIDIFRTQLGYKKKVYWDANRICWLLNFFFLWDASSMLSYKNIKSILHKTF